ncbi:hypothetical protein U9X54_25455, partial [Escherichia coli]
FIPCFGDRVCGKGWGKPFGGACFGGLKLWLFFAQFSRVILVFVMNIPHQITACPDRSRLNVRR